MGSGLNKIRGRVNYIGAAQYKEFKKKHPATDITKEQFITILKESNKAIRDHILDNPLGFKLPFSMGYIAVDKFKPSKGSNAVDWKNTVKYGRKIPQLNLHSFGYVYKIKLYSNPSIKPLAIYGMTAHRIMKRMLANNIKTTSKEYICMDRSYFNRRFRIDRIIKQNI